MSRLKKKENEQKILETILVLTAMATFMMMLYNFFITRGGTVASILIGGAAVEPLDVGYLWAYTMMALGYACYVPAVICLFKRNSYKEIFRKTLGMEQSLLIMLFGWSLVSLAFSSDKAVSLFGSQSTQANGVSMYIAYLGFFLAAYFYREELQIYKTFRVYLVFAAFTALPLLINRTEFNDALRIYYYRVNVYNSGIFSNSNHAAYYLCITVMIAVLFFLEQGNQRKKMIFTGLIFAYFSASLYQTNSLGPYGSVLIGLIMMTVLFIIWKKNHTDLEKKEQYVRKTVAALGIFLVISLAFSFFNNWVFKSVSNVSSAQADTEDSDKISGWGMAEVYAYDIEIPVAPDSTDQKNGSNDPFDDFGNGRGILWKTAWNRMLKYPLVGTGPDNFGFIQNGLGDYMDHVHNEFLQIGACMGFPAMFLYIAAIAVYAVKFLKKLKKRTPLDIILFSAVAVYIAQSTVGNEFFYTTPYFCILWGISSGLMRQEDIAEQVIVK